MYSRVGLSAHPISQPKICMRSRSRQIIAGFADLQILRNSQIKWLSCSAPARHLIPGSSRSCVGCFVVFFFIFLLLSSFPFKLTFNIFLSYFFFPFHTNKVDLRKFGSIPYTKGNSARTNIRDISQRGGGGWKTTSFACYFLEL